MESANMENNLSTHAAASLIAGTVATTVCAPADVLKSRLQSAAESEVSFFQGSNCNKS